MLLTPAFNVLDLPSLAIEEVLNELRPIDLITLSFASSAVNALIKLFLLKNFQLEIYSFENVGHIDIVTSPTEKIKIHVLEKDPSRLEGIFHVQNCQIHDSTVPVHTDDKWLTTFWDDQMFGIGTLVNHFIDIFDARVRKLVLEDTEVGKVNMIMNPIVARQSRIEVLDVKVEGFTNTRLRVIGNVSQPGCGGSYCGEGCWSCEIVTVWSEQEAVLMYSKYFEFS